MSDRIRAFLARTYGPAFSHTGYGDGFQAGLWTAVCVGIILDAVIFWLVLATRCGL